MATRNRANDFLRAMNPDQAEPVALVPAATTTAGLPAPANQSAPNTAPAVKVRSPTRIGLKHIGAYLDKETVEKVAVLRARLDKDNSELIKFAIEELYRKHTAKRAFGDA